MLRVLKTMSRANDGQPPRALFCFSAFPRGLILGDLLRMSFRIFSFTNNRPGFFPRKYPPDSLFRASPRFSLDQNDFIPIIMGGWSFFLSSNSRSSNALALNGVKEAFFFISAVCTS